MTTTTLLETTHHCSDCGAQVEEFCPDHPRAMIDSIVSPRSPAAPFRVGDLVLLRYGNGTQAARVSRVTRAGGYCVSRFVPFWTPTGDHGRWRDAARAPLRADQLLGPLPANDPRRRLPGW